MTLGFTTCMLHSVKCCREALQVKRGGNKLRKASVLSLQL